MITAGKSIPNFAGVALVDILANGVAVLIIVIILSIAARSEKEQRYVDQVKEVSAVMTREFSTSLVLNRLASSPAAVLHDYENSPMDLFWDPHLLPIIEMHTDTVRDPYSGKVWRKAELLQEPNSFDAWLEQLGETQRVALRGDLYDVGTYYLVMSILRDHGMQINHWHFMGATGGGVNVWGCPPGRSAADCVGSGGGGFSDFDLLDRLGNQDGTDSNGRTENGNGGNGDWPQERSSREEGPGRGQLADELPSGVNIGNFSQTPGIGSGNPTGNNSFPEVTPFRSGQTGSPEGSPSGSPGQNNTISIRLSDPTLMNQPEGAITIDMPALTTEQLLRALMVYLAAIQVRLDDGQPPTPLLSNFMTALASLVQSQPSLPPDLDATVEDLVANIALNARFTEQPIREPLSVIPLQNDDAPIGTLMKLLPNRLLFDVEVAATSDQLLNTLPEQATPLLNLNAYPDIWRGVQVRLERNSVIMSVPLDQAETIPHWRAVAYVSPTLDDLIIGFLHVTVDDDGYLHVLGEPNQVQIGETNLLETKEIAIFGVRTWVFGLYFLFGMALIALLFFWRPWARISQ